MSYRVNNHLKNKGLLAILAALFLFSAPLSAEAPLPDIPKGKGDQCVEPTDVMRKNHFEFLLHQRDLTMHEGIRSKKHSLKECIDCHVVEEAGKPVSIANPKHFCRECHDYASVTIDCFECHASKPRAKKMVLRETVSTPPQVIQSMETSE